MRRPFLATLLALDAVLFVLLVVAFAFADPGTPAYAISQISAGIVLLTGALIVVAIRKDVSAIEP